jgi:hypothetical protein
VTLMALFVWRLYKYAVANSKGHLLVFWHTWYPCESKQTPPTHLHHRFIIMVRLRVIPSVFAWVIASSGSWGSLWPWISCFSWWLPPPRRLGAAEEDWHELVIVRGHLSVIVRGLVPSLAESRKVTLVDCSWHWVTSLVGRFLRCPMCGWGSCNTS